MAEDLIRFINKMEEPSPVYCEEADEIGELAREAEEEFRELPEEQKKRIHN